MASPERKSEWMRAVRTHDEEKLEKELVGICEASIGKVPQMSVAILPADLAKLAGPVGQNAGKAGVGQAGVGSAAASVVASTNGPAPVDTVFAVRVHAESVLRLESVEGRQLIPGA